MRSPQLLLTLALLTLLALLVPAELVAQDNPGTSAPNARKAGAPSMSARPQQIDALDSDIARMRSLLSQMQMNLPFVASTENPLKHQFELEIEMWGLVIADLEQHVNALRSSAAAPDARGAESSTAPGAPAQPNSGRNTSPNRAARFDGLLDNQYVRVSRLELPPPSRASVYQDVNDVVWIAVNTGTLTFFAQDQQSKKINFAPGDVRIFRRNQIVSVANGSDAAANGDVSQLSVIVQLKQPGLIYGGCGCDTQVETSVCGCVGAAHLPELWAVGLGKVTLAGTTLQPAQVFGGSAPRGDTLLVAISSLELSEAGGGSSLRLAAGEAAWIRAGLHRFVNQSTSPVHFVTVEF